MDVGNGAGGRGALLVRPDGPAATNRVWACSLRTTGNDLVLTTDRTKGLILRPA